MALTSERSGLAHQVTVLNPKSDEGVSGSLMEPATLLRESPRGTCSETRTLSYERTCSRWLYFRRCCSTKCTTTTRRWWPQRHAMSSMKRYLYIPKRVSISRWKFNVISLLYRVISSLKCIATGCGDHDIHGFPGFSRRPTGRPNLTCKKYAKNMKSITWAYTTASPISSHECELQPRIVVDLHSSSSPCSYSMGLPSLLRLLLQHPPTQRIATFHKLQRMLIRQCIVLRNVLIATLTFRLTLISPLFRGWSHCPT